MGKIETLDTIAQALQLPRQSGRTLVLSNGAFDLLHVGHIRYLQSAAKLGDILVVAINSDDSVRRLKGQNRPVFPENERAEIVAAVQGVDWVTIFSEDTVSHIIQILKPHIHAKGTDYTEDSVPELQMVKRYGGRVAIAGDPKNHSSSWILRHLQQYKS